MVYWMVALPLEQHRGRKDAVWEALQERTASMGLSQNSKLEVPELRIGTLDTLMALSDDLSKACHTVESVVTKAKRQVHETAGPEAVSGLKVEGLPSEVYLTRFRWDEAKFPVRRPLRDTVDKMGEITARIEDELKVKVSEYTVLKGTLAAAARKHAGNLSVRDISSFVQPQHLVDSENLTTMFVVVSKFALAEWWQSYEKLSNFVVPRSSRLVTEDNDYALVTAVMFKRVVDEFKVAARSKGYQVREYVPPSESNELSAAQAERMRADLESKRLAMEAWCRTAYGQAFSVWVHMCVVRLFVEAILRYGLPPAFQAAVVHPYEKKEAKLRQVLAEAFGDGKASLWRGDEGQVAGAGLLGGDTEFFSYVSITMHVEALGLSSGGDGDEEMEEQGASPGLRRMNARERAVFWSVWCKQHGFPVLASVAPRLLSMHPTSCASERNWSVVGQLYSKARSNLALERARKLVYVRCNQVDNVQLEQLEHFMELLGLEDG